MRSYLYLLVVGVGPINEKWLDTRVITGNLDNIFINLTELFMGTVVMIDCGA